MAIVTGFTAERMLEMENATIISGTVNPSGDLILMTKDGTVVNAGHVKGADATALLQIIDSSTVDLTLTGAGTPASPWQLSANVAISSSTVKGLVELATDTEATAGTDTTRAITPANLKAVLAGRLNSASIRLTDTGDASLTSTGHAFQIGDDSAFNLIIDNNEMMARNNGVGSALNLNIDGGNVNLGAGTSDVQVNGKLKLPTSSRVLWNASPLFMHGTQSITLSETVSSQANGIVLCWSRYSGGAAVNDTWTYDFVPKWHVANMAGQGIVFLAPVNTSNGTTASGLITKYCYINDTTITGNDVNDDNAANTRVLRAVIGV